MAATPSVTRIGNRSLILLGTAQRINSIDDATPLANAIRDLIDDCRQEVLAEHPWNPAIRRAVLAEATNGDDVPTELGEWTTVWGLPGDCLRWLPWRANHEFGFSGVREGRFLLTGDIDAPTIRYIADLTDYARWSPGMREALAGKLAMWLASAAPVQSQTSARKAAEIYEDALSRGRRMDGLETNDREGDAMGRSNWLAARESFGADCD